ncbi:putative CLAVATA3/ESR (CLE)-related protein 25-like [Capsicum annuum]|uniref:Myb-like domain-containing protein n=1 Tax=Capsicum annuum TaxID=4072 RepID=A0A1U8GCQ5_CAPAN|nr:uncharacterized protein LOC107867405 isoform X1 [Capsicum annuum]KAF3662674.1 putative CLAVATA3/ESR (CLE)-related protein 25-like [Capsicum annuum]KAF3676180.1 putative CLAVATA3/ESR (CLE)-related protein 25-like [Capsicum annuum]PHT94328.1 hypothetical protein T459_02210 [Capsicum annuum]
MEMAAESNTGFYHQSLSFQSGAIGGSSSSEMMLMGNYYSSFGMNFNVNSNNGGGREMLYAGNPSGIANGGRSSSNPGMSQPGSCSNSFLIDSVPGLKHDTGLAVEWTVEEQYKLDEGLIKFANEPSIMKYIKIAATLHDKTVRDVALRCRWMTRKRRKQEDYNLGKKVKDRKEKSVEASVKTGTSSASPLSFIPYSLSSNHHDAMPSAALLGTRHLLEENNQALNQISANLSTVKLQDNFDLFIRTRNNITTILNDMRNMPGIMSQMPPLPILLNEELASSVLPSATRPMIFASTSGIQLKQEPGC